MKPLPPMQPKVMKEIYGENYHFIVESNYIWAKKNHKYLVEYFNLKFPMVINLN